MLRAAAGCMPVAAVEKGWAATAGWAVEGLAAVIWV